MKKGVVGKSTSVVCEKVKAGKGGAEVEER
jgi:hypothetical protein